MSPLAGGQRRPASKAAGIEAVIETTPRGRVIGWNSGAESLFGITSREAVGWAVGDLVRLAARRLAGDHPSDPDPPGPDLPRRQRQVLTLIADGLTTREIAERLGLSPKTVETHRSRLMRRLGARNLAELLRRALEAGMVQFPSRGQAVKRRT